MTKLESQDQLKVDIRWNMPMISASFLTVCCVLGKTLLSLHLSTQESKQEPVNREGNIIHLMYGPKGNSFVFLESSCLPR